MIRSLFASLAALALGLSAASADELKGTLKKVNKAGNSLTLTVDGKDKVLPVGKDASFVTVSSEKGKKGKPMEKVTPIDGGLASLKEGSAVTVLTEKTDDKESVTSVKVTGGDAPAKKAKKAKKAKPAKANATSAISFISEDLNAGDRATKKAAKGKKSKKGDKKAAKGKKKAGKKAAKGKKGKGKKGKGKKGKGMKAKKSKKTK